MKIGLMTGGGDCPGLNAVIRAVVKTGTEKLGLEILGIEDAFWGLIDLERKSPNGNRWLHAADVRNILARGGTILGTSNKSDPFRLVLPGETVERDVSEVVIRHMRSLGLDGIISIGGDGSMRIAQKLFEKGVPIIGVPKTIDNDLDATDQTFGFDTAVSIAMEALDRLRDTAESHDRVMIVELMGRDAGWIALHAGLAAGADAILIPEIPYDVEVVARMIERRRERGQHYSIVVVAEGAHPKGGKASGHSARPGEMRRLAGAGAGLSDALAERIDAEMRVTVLGHVQRGGSPSNFDRILGTRYGHRAAELAVAKRWGQMVALRDGAIVEVAIADAVSRQKLVTPDHQLVRTGRATGVVFGDEV